MVLRLSIAGARFMRDMAHAVQKEFRRWMLRYSFRRRRLVCPSASTVEAWSFAAALFLHRAFIDEQIGAGLAGDHNVDLAITVHVCRANLKTRSHIALVNNMAREG